MAGYEVLEAWIVYMNKKKNQEKRQRQTQMQVSALSAMGQYDV
jgi:hypothetical protein